jgi:hypothetical protein
MDDATAIASKSLRRRLLETVLRPFGYLLLFLFWAFRFGLPFGISLFWFQPVFLYQLIVWIRFPTHTGAIAVAAGFLANLLFGGITALSTLAGLRAILYKNLTDNFLQCDFTQYPCNAYLDETTLKRADSESFQATLRIAYGKLYDFQRDTQIYVVGRGASKNVPLQLFAYAIPYLVSYIFLRDEPSRLRIPAKYFVRHEIGHVLRRPQYARSFLWLANRALFFSLFWIAWCLSWSPQTAVLFALLLVTAFSLRSEIRRRIERFRLSDEISADAFALSTLSQEELHRVEELSAKGLFLADNDLSPEDNVIRHAFFQENIRRLKQGSIELETSIQELSKVPLSVVSAVLLIIALAQYGVAPSGAFLKGVSLGIIAPLLALILLLVIFTVKLGSWIERILDGHSPSSLPRVAVNDNMHS